QAGDGECSQREAGGVQVAVFRGRPPPEQLALAGDNLGQGALQLLAGARSDVAAAGCRRDVAQRGFREPGRDPPPGVVPEKRLPAVRGAQRDWRRVVRADADAVDTVALRARGGERAGELAPVVLAVRD